MKTIMEPLLFLVHRIPYPPNKGDKIRSFHLLNAIAKSFRVHMGAFVDVQEDWVYEKDLRKYCDSYMLRPLKPAMAKLRSLSAFYENLPMSIPYYRDKSLQQWVNKTIRDNNIKKIMVFSSTMAQYVEGEEFKECRRIADMVDIDSDKWLQYSKKKAFPMSWIYKREAYKLAAYEREVTNTFNYTLFVSKEEMQQYASGNPGVDQRLDYYKNGVDTDYFNPSQKFQNPYPASKLVIAFTGAMDYWANIDAVTWFAKSIFPKIIKENNKAHFYIVGSNPAADVLALNNNSNVTVTGPVHDIRPFIKYARVIVAPLRIARGIQNKVLEGMAMAKPVIATSAAIDGIEPCPGYRPLLANNEEEFVRTCINVLQDDQYKLGMAQARECIRQNYDWNTNLSKVMHLFGCK